MSTMTTFDVGVTTLTDVSGISQIAYDIRDMADHLDNGDYLEARRIYEQGRHVRQYDIYGNEKDDLLSLQHMSGAGSGGMFNEDPTYMFQVLGMADAGQSIKESLAAHGEYADRYIMEQLRDYDSGTLGAQASTILVVFMYTAHMLWDGLLDCVAVNKGYNADVDWVDDDSEEYVDDDGDGEDEDDDYDELDMKSVGTADNTGRINPMQKFDNFIALYIGAGQTLGSDWDGDMLYALAQSGARFFDTADPNGEAIVNSDIKQLYKSIQRTMSEENYCKGDHSIGWVWMLVNRIIASMYVPMVQMLIHSMQQEDQAHKVRMYSLAVIPQLSQCRPSVHAKLKEYLLDNEYNKRNFGRILTLLQQSYDCLGFTCEDVGAYKQTQVAECAGYDEEYPLASFIPKEDVRSLSKVDLDILAIDQLLKFPSKTSNKMAQLYYQHGRAAKLDDSDSGYKMMSLKEMQESTDDNQWSPYYTTYVEYYKMDKFDDSAIMAAFGGDVLPDLLPRQRRHYIATLMRYGVIPKYMMSMLGLALQNCKDGENGYKPVLSWDAFGALFIGSLEGIEEGGSDDGLLLWSLANNRARQFNTQTKGYLAVINEEMTDLLFAGQGQLERGDCSGFEKTASRSLHLMLVPLIQSTIWYAIQNEDRAAGSTHEDLAIGEAMAFSVLPIVAKYRDNAAAVIERNMVRVSGTKPVMEGAQAVADALFLILDDSGWGCEYVGQAEGIDTCHRGFNPMLVKSTGSAALRLDLVAFSIGLAAIVCGALAL